MNGFKKLFSIIITIAMISGTLTGCGKQDEKTGTNSVDTNTASGDKPVVRMIVPGINDQDTIDPISGIKSLSLGAFEEILEEQIPDVDIQLTSIPWDGWIQKMEATIAAEEVDIGFYTNQVMAPDWFVDHRQFLEKDTEVNLDNLDDIFIEPAVHYMTYKSFNYPEATGQIFGLPVTMASNIFVYDKQLFEDWGVELPGDNVTYEELISKAEQMNGVNPKTGAKNYGAYIASMWMEWNAIGFDAVKSYSSDTMLLSEMDKSQYVDYIKESPEVLNFFQNMERIVKVSPEGIATNSGSEKFFTKDNDIAINFDTNAISGSMLKYIYADKKEITDRFIPITIPTGSGGMQGFPEFFRYAVTKNAKNPELAWKVIKALATNKAINDFYLTNYAKDKLTALKDFNGMKCMEYDINKKRHENQLKTMFITDDYWFWRTPMQNVLSQVIAKQVTPEQAREELYKGVNDWVENTKKQLGQ
ncbi:extracellular solute-binding protein [Anaerocolumna sedimenticola]|uniref:Extracellular solute-binding protein n=1 Tax=Anaerocolumna sedimenticola TaxID=2696063 RepID=A0A6P1TMJ0_9FIRM|nr:extracellular solute-binding protein [Anaerocolumna sedimenticola]QHQ61076.1 extracellular solute-binding protein [Anaerocolumna sedimenticola]